MPTGYKTWKAPVKSSPQTNQHQVFFLQDGCPSCHPTNSVNALKGNEIHQNTKQLNYCKYGAYVISY